MSIIMRTYSTWKKQFFCKEIMIFYTNAPLWYFSIIVWEIKSSFCVTGSATTISVHNLFSPNMFVISSFWSQSHTPCYRVRAIELTQSIFLNLIALYVERSLKNNQGFEQKMKRCLKPSNIFQIVSKTFACKLAFRKTKPCHAKCEKDS